MKSLKAKFSVVITVLIIVVIAATAGTLIFQEKTEIENDIYVNARSFGELTADDVVNVGQTYLPSNSFVFFNRDLNQILEKNGDIQGAKIYTFSGEVMYDYEEEAQAQYTGAQRTINGNILTRTKAPNPSLLTSKGTTIYLDQTEAGQYNLTDENGAPVDASFGELNRIENMIFPVNNEFAVLYDITYQNLFSRLFARAIFIAIIAGAGILISIILGLLLAGAVTRPLKKLTVVVGEIAKGDFSKRAKVKTKDEVGQLAQSVNQMAIDLEKATEARIYQERVKKELEIAAKIQQDLIPKEIPEIEGIDISGQIWPATEIGGDVFDILQDQKGQSYFYVGDVTGHGVPAGLISAIANATIASTIETADLDSIIDSVNKVLRMKTAKNLFITMVLIKHSPGGKIDYLNAGHEQLLIYRAADKKAEYANPGGIALGMFDEVGDKLKVENLQLNKGDVAVIYSDGVPENWKNEKEQYGPERFQQALEKYGSLTSADEIKKALYDDVKAYSGGYEQKDDITLVVIKQD